MHFIPATLHDLRHRVFLPAGRDIRLVGGAVRDWRSGNVPHDFDLATDASPDEQLALYAQHGIQHIPTGLKHGTVTVVLDHIPFEITSLRVETDHDGRHATVHWTNDWIADLARRDLTINAMALTFDGDLLDPFGGAEDLASRRIVFVGDPEQRMREDYLRILRWLRFHGRIAGSEPLNPAAVEAAQKVGEGLKGISRERVWSEMSRILGGPAAPDMVLALTKLGLDRHIDLPEGNIDRLADANHMSRDPVALLAAYVEGRQDVMDKLALDWKWSTEDRKRGLFITKRLNENFHPFDLVARDGHPKAWVAELLRIRGDGETAIQIEGWTVPVFPISGNDLLARGIPSGPMIGQTLTALRDVWAIMHYTDDKEAILNAIKSPNMER